MSGTTWPRRELNMKALSIRQPWAWLIAHGYKDVENRTWKTNFRGEFLIHAGEKFDKEGYSWVMISANDEKFDIDPLITLPPPYNFERGGIVGRAEIIDCVTEHDSPWFSGAYGFVVRNAEPLEFRPYKGRLGFFKVEGI